MTYGTWAGVRFMRGRALTARGMAAKRTGFWPPKGPMELI